jgi:hypothetical protein
MLICSILAIGKILSDYSVMAASESELKALKEMERQLREWEREGRIEDLKIINLRQSALVKQVESGRVDLQAILDDHNNNLKAKTATVQGRISRATTQ